MWICVTVCVCLRVCVTVCVCLFEGVSERVAVDMCDGVCVSV